MECGSDGTTEATLPSLCHCPIITPVNQEDNNTGPQTSTSLRIQVLSECLLNLTDDTISLSDVPSSILALLGELAGMHLATDDELRSQGLWDSWRRVFAMPALNHALLTDLERDGKPYLMGALRWHFSAEKWNKHLRTHHLLNTALQSIVKPASSSLLRCVTVQSPSELRRSYFLDPSIAACLTRVIDMDLTWHRGQPLMLGRWLGIADYGDETTLRMMQALKHAVSQPGMTPPTPEMVRLLLSQHNLGWALSDPNWDFLLFEWLSHSVRLDSKLCRGRRTRVKLFRELLVPQWKWEDWSMQPRLQQQLHDLNLSHSDRFYFKVLSDSSMMGWPRWMCSLVQSFLKPPLTQACCKEDKFTTVTEASQRWGRLPHYSTSIMSRLDVGSNEEWKFEKTKDVRNSEPMFPCARLIQRTASVRFKVRSELIKHTLPKRDHIRFREIVFCGDSLLHLSLECDLKLGGGSWMNTLELCKAIDDSVLWNEMCTLMFDHNGYLPVHRAVSHDIPVPLPMIRLLLPSNVCLSQLQNHLLTEDHECCEDLAILADSDQGYRMKTRQLLLMDLETYLGDYHYRSSIMRNPRDFVSKWRGQMSELEMETWLISEGIKCDVISHVLNLYDS